MPNKCFFFMRNTKKKLKEILFCWKARLWLEISSPLRTCFASLRVNRIYLSNDLSLFIVWTDRLEQCSSDNFIVWKGIWKLNVQEKPIQPIIHNTGTIECSADWLTLFIERSCSPQFLPGCHERVQKFGPNKSIHSFEAHLLDNGQTLYAKL